MAPTPRGVAVIVAGIAAAMLPVVAGERLWPFWPVFVAWAIVVFGVDAILAPRARDVASDVTLPAQLAIGEAGAAEIALTAPARRPLAVELVADLAAPFDADMRRRVDVVDGRGSARIPLVPRRRGTARLESLWLRYTGPLGLMRRTVRRPLDRAVPVVPDVRPVRAVALRYRLHQDARVGTRVERFRGEGSEFDSLDEFNSGDDTRALDWKHSARHRKLLVRQFRAERNRQVVVAVDTGRLMGEQLDGIPKLDHAINAALLLSWVCLKNGDRVGLFTFGARGGRLLQPQSGPRAHAALTRLTADIEYSEEETNFTLGLTTLGQQVRRRSLVVLLTDFADTVSAELLLGNMNRLSRRHLLVFVALRDPQLERIAAAPPTSSVALHRAVVADEFLRDREVVMHRLRRMGILTIDTEPRRLGTRLVNRYLDVKRREMV